MRVRGAVVAFAVMLLAACPLPFEFVPENTTGEVAASNDPANPSITAPPVFTASETTTGAAVPDHDGADTLYYDIQTNRDVTIELSSLTPGATIFYREDGNDPIPGQPGTHTYSADTPIQFAGHGDGPDDLIKAIAIGPGMYPSSTSSADVIVQYDQAAAPTFTPDPGGYQVDLSVVLATSEANGTIYYRVEDGFASGPNPVAGSGDTLQFTGSGIPVIGAGTAKTVSAYVVVPEKLDSAVAIGTYYIDIDLVPPLGFTATTTFVDRVDLSWSAPPNADTYDIERSADGTNFVTLKERHASLSYTDTDGSIGVSYTYRARAWFGTVPGPYATATGLRPASAPTGFTASTTNVDQVNLSWGGVAGAAGYEVSRSEDGTTYNVLGNVGVATFAFQDTSGDVGVSYTYRVRADYGGAFGPYASATGLRPATAPTGFSATTTLPDRIRLDWDAKPYATGYVVTRSVDGSTFLPFGTYGSTTTTVSDTSVAVGPGYAYRIQAEFGDLYGPYATASGRAGRVWYLRHLSSEPWGYTDDNINSNVAAMDLAFGAGNWNLGDYTTASGAAVFEPGSVVFVDGSLNTAPLQSFLTSNMALIETWLNSGGRLFVNACPGGVITLNLNSNLYQTIDSIDVRTATFANPSHPIRLGPQTAFDSYEGNWFAHGTVGATGVYTSVLNGYDSSGGYIAPAVIEARFGAGDQGMLLIGSMTLGHFHWAPSAGETGSPSANAHGAKLRANMLDYLAND